jgi:hypothetical protein
LDKRTILSKRERFKMAEKYVRLYTDFSGFTLMRDNMSFWAWPKPDEHDFEIYVAVSDIEEYDSEDECYKIKGKD